MPDFTPKSISYPKYAEAIKASNSPSALADTLKDLAVSADIAIDKTIGAIPARLTAVETKNTEQDVRLVNVEAKNLEQDGKLAAPWMPAQAPAFEDFAEIVHDTQGNIAYGVKNDGSTYIARSETGIETLSDDGGTGYHYSETSDSAGRIAEPGSIDRNGHTPAWVLANHAERTAKALLGIAAFGDSMTIGLGGGGSSYPKTLMQKTGLPVWNYGISSQSSTEVALRSGALDVWITVSGGLIPASGSVAVTSVIPSGKWHETNSWTFEGHLGGVRGVLTKSTAGAWSFARFVAGSAVTVPPETRWESAQQPGSLVGRIIWVGRNYPILENVVRDVQAMVSDAQRVGAPYLVIPPFNNGSEPSGSAGYENIIAIGEALQLAHGPNCYDLRGYIIRNGLAQASITPTAADNTAINEDRIPPSIMSDNIHLNGAGYIVAGNRIHEVTSSKGWY